MRQRSFHLGLGIMFLVGVFDMTRSISGPLLQQSFGLSYSQLGYLFASVSIGYLLGSLSCGWLVDHVGIKPSVLTGGIITVIGFAIPATAHGFGLAMVGFCLSGLGSGWMEVGVNTLVPVIANGLQGSANTERQAGMFNVLHGFYGAGAFIFPVAGTWLIAVFSGWRPLYVVLSVVLALWLLAIAASRFPRPQRRSNPPTSIQLVDEALVADSLTATAAQAYEATSGEGQRPRERLPLTAPLVGLLLAISAYVMAESGIGAWLPVYLIHVRHLTLAASAVYLSGFYLTYTVGRLSGHLWVHRVGHYRAIVVSAIVAIALVILGELSGQWSSLFIFSGFGFAVIFPTITALASETFPAHSGKVLGLLFTFTGVGFTVCNWLIGWLASQYNLQVGFAIIPVCLVVALAGLFITWFGARTQTQGQWSR